MSLSILGISDAGDPVRERLVITCTSGPEELNKYIVLCSPEAKGGFNSVAKETFWFPPQTVNTADTVVLYTRKDENRVRENKRGTSSYFFYWGLKPLWNVSEDVVILARIERYGLHITSEEVE